jgi:alkylation response protein AidB-like acyl-CoA dehydrogenase
VDFTYPPEAEAFRAELRAWLEEHLTDELRELARTSTLDPDPATLERLRTWNQSLADARYAAISWPVEHGGRDASVLEQVVFTEEMSRAGAPGTLNPIGLANIAPSIIAFGTEEQKRRFLFPMLRGDEIWCQGFSEPDAGSDLAGLRMTAVRDGDHYVVNGQKVWNTLGHLASWCELLVRTDADAPKHKGITCLLVDMLLPGIEVRPLVTITGDREFNELFFTDVRVPIDARLGDEHDGWRVAMTTLTHERGGVAALHLGLRRKVSRLLESTRGMDAGADAVLRQQLARVYTEGEILRLLADRAVSALAQGRAPGAEASVGKLWWSSAEQHLAEVAAQLHGMATLTGPAGRDVVFSRSLSIAGGTTEINKDIVATRVLGLPR